MRGALGLLLLCSLACIVACTSQAVSQPGGQLAAPEHTATDQRGRSAGPRGFQAALAAKRDRRHKRHLERLERQYDDYTDQTDVLASSDEPAEVREDYEEEAGIRQPAAEAPPQQLFPLIALAAAAFAAGVLLGYELGRAGSTSSFSTPNQPIPAVLSTTSQGSREEQELSSSSPFMPALDQAISQASEKRELRLHARTAAAAIESSSEADPKLFASAASMKDARAPSQLPQPEQLNAGWEQPLPYSDDTDNGGAEIALQPQTNNDSQSLPFPDTSALASSSSPTNIRYPTGDEGYSAHQGNQAVEGEGPSVASATAEISADLGLDNPTAMNADPFTSGPQPESIETASDSKQQASSSGQVDLGSTRLEPDMLQSMQWVTSSSGYGSAGGQQSEHWSRVTAFWREYTRELGINVNDLSPGERIQLAGVLLQAWALSQQQSHHQQSSQLQEEANKHHAVAAAAAQDASAVKRARFEASVDAAQLARFQATLGDGLLFGMVVMLGAAAVCAYQGGVAELLFGSCPAMSDVGTVSWYNPLAALNYLKVMGCWAAGVSDVLMASAVMLLVGRYLASSGALVGAHGAPLRKVALGLGLACGAAGYFVVRRLRGNATRWLVGWEVWVLLHLVVAWYMPRVLKALAAPKRVPVPGKRAEQGAENTALHRMLSSAALPAYHVLMALLLPAAVGVAAFGSASQLQAFHNMWP